MQARILLICSFICIYSLAISQEITELTFDPMTMNGRYFITLSNHGGANNLEDYPTRPEYKFSGPEKIFKLPKMGGDFFWFVDGRTPDIEVDFFILTDPNDASSSMMWMNGTGTKMRMTADPNTDYFLVIDGFANTEAAVQFSMAYAPPIPEVCNNIASIDLSDYLTMGVPDDITWNFEEGGSGQLNSDTGIFTLDENSDGKYRFKAKKNQQDEDLASEEEICIIIKTCPIPTMSQWGLFILALLFLVSGIAIFKIQAAKNAA